MVTAAEFPALLRAWLHARAEVRRARQRADQAVQDAWRVHPEQDGAGRQRVVLARWILEFRRARPGARVELVVRRNEAALEVPLEGVPRDGLRPSGRAFLEESAVSRVLDARQDLDLAVLAEKWAFADLLRKGAATLPGGGPC